jgi:hypothetical protein
LVQFGYFFLGRNPAKTAGKYTPQEMAAIKSIVPGETYSGAYTDKLSVAIRAQQRVRGGTQDGRVSPVQSSAGVYAEGLTWMIIALCNHIKDLNLQQWPVLHRMTGCPSQLAAASKRTFRL